MDGELSSPKHQQIKCSLLSFHHILHTLASGNTQTHRALELKETVLSEKCKYLLIAMKAALLFIKALEVLLLFTYPT